MSFRLKTIIGVATIEALLLFLLIFSGLWYISNSAQTEFVNRAKSTANAFAITTKDAVLATDMASLDSFVKEALRFPDVLYARIRDHRGRILASSGDADLLQREFELDETFDGVNDGILDTNARIEESGMHFGIVEIGLSTKNLEDLVSTAKQYGASIGIAEMLLVAIFSFVLGGYLTRQLTSLTEGSRHIASGNFGYQIDAKGKDELAQTANAFNLMSLKVQSIYDEINKREKYWRQVFNSTLDAVIVIDGRGTIKSFNLGAELMLGYTADEAIGSNISMIVPEPHKSLHDEYIENYIETGEENIIGKSRDFTVYRKNGEGLTINLRVTKMLDVNEPMFIGVIHDISKLKQNEMELRQSVDEKEVLLKEIHHRVKNNLLVVSSILELQKDAYEDPRLSQAIDLSQGRIKSMSMIHESLYQSNNLSSVDFSTYLDTLSDDLLHAYSVKNANIRIIKNLDSLALNIETATPLGLIVNELITNSLKHAFDPEAPGILEIKLCRQDDDSFSLCISDNGKATHQESDFSESAGLGWKLIRLLASQLDASIVIQPNDGLTVCIQASQLNYRKRGV